MPTLQEPISIRAPRDADYSQWRMLWDGYLTFYRHELPEETTQATWQRLLSDDPHFVGLVAASADDDPVGFTHIIFHPSTWSRTSYCYLEDLFVTPDLRGRGIARSLIGAVYDLADERRCDRVYWVTQEFNYPGRMLYDKMAQKMPFVIYERE